MNIRLSEFYFIPTDPGESINITNKLKMKNSQGFDNISTKLLKSTIDGIIIYLSAKWDSS